MPLGRYSRTWLSRRYMGRPSWSGDVRRLPMSPRAGENLHGPSIGIAEHRSTTPRILVRLLQDDCAGAHRCFYCRIYGLHCITSERTARLTETCGVTGSFGREDGNVDVSEVARVVRRSRLIVLLVDKRNADRPVEGDTLLRVRRKEYEGSDAGGLLHSLMLPAAVRAPRMCAVGCVP